MAEPFEVSELWGQEMASDEADVSLHRMRHLLEETDAHLNQEEA